MKNTRIAIIVAAAFAGAIVAQGQMIQPRQIGRAGLAQSVAANATRPAKASPNFAYTLLDYPGAIAQQLLFGINDKGAVVGYYNTVDGNANGFLLQGKTFKDVIFPLAVLTLPTGINRGGTVVGTYLLDAGGIDFHGFTLSHNTFTTIDFPAATWTSAHGINRTGDIVGTYANADGVTHGFLLSNGVYTTIDVPFGASATLPYGINSSQTIVGSYQKSDGTSHGFMLQNGVYTTVDFSGATENDAWGITDSGDIVGDYSIDGSVSHGFFLNAGVMTSFDVPYPGTNSMLPGGINNRHQIVGAYGSSDSQNFYSFGFLATY